MISKTYKWNNVQLIHGLFIKNKQKNTLEIEKYLHNDESAI